jgi:sugar lactone lactonase YvrE
MGGGSYSGDGGQATVANLNNPNGVAFDAAGNMYIADQNNARIRMVNTAGIIITIAGDSTGGYSGDGGQATAAELADPDGITFDAAGNLYIADAFNNRVRIVNTAGIITTVVGTGAGAGTYTCCYGGDGGQATAAAINMPGGVTFDAAGNLYIADLKNHRIRMVCFSTCATTSIEQVTVTISNINAYPNPFVNEANISYSLANASYVTVSIYTPEGMLVANLDSKMQPAGQHNLVWNASSLNEGVYNISIISNEGVVNKRLVIVR